MSKPIEQKTKREPTPEDLEKEKADLFIKEFFGLDMEELEKVFQVIQNFMDMLRGVKDIKGRLSPLMEPKGLAIETSARLTPIQAQASGIQFALADLYAFFKPLEIPAIHNNLSSISKDGLGREEGIRLMGAYSGSELLREVMKGGFVSDLSRKQAEKKGKFK